MKTEKKEKPVEDKPKRVKKKDIEDTKIQELLSSYSSYDWTQFESFSSIPLSSRTLDGLLQNGFTAPTDIQRKAIGSALRGRDVLGAAKTGSGKTLAFLVPILEVLYTNKWTQIDGIGALVITPTRELSYQIFEVLRKVGINHDFSAGLIIGGKDLKFERKRLDKCNVIVCTPGRLLQHMDENPLFACDNLKVLVLDEADRCLDMGFAATMNAIIENLPQRRQTLLFSATQTKSVKDLARLSLKDPEYVWVHENDKHSTPEALTQSYIVCDLEDKLNMLWSFIRSHKKHKILVFMSSCKQVKYCYDLFCRMRPGVSLLALYGTLHQLRRMAIYDEFCRKQSAVLFATDIASRGLDFPSVNWVLQLDSPEDVNTYIHRVGRTARFEKDGESLLVVLPSEEQSMVDQLTQKKIPINKIEVNPKKMYSIQRKAEALCARDPSLKESAQRAFKSYIKNVFLMKDKTVFDIKNLNSDLFANSLGLAITPRIRFIEKSLQQKKNSEEYKTKANTESDNKINFNDLNDGNQSDDDLFSVKKVWRFDLNEELDGSRPEPKEKEKKAVTKAAMAKKLLKKKFKPNSRVVFNEDGTVAEDFPTRQVSEKVKELDEKGISGIDIEIAKQIMKDEDVIDKKLYKDLVKAKHKEKRLKLKEQKRREKESRSGSAVLGGRSGGGVDDSSYNQLNSLIDALPDPDVVYGQQSDQSSGNESDDSGEYDEENEGMSGSEDQMSDRPEESDEHSDRSEDESNESDNRHTFKRKPKQEIMMNKKQKLGNGLDLTDWSVLASAQSVSQSVASSRVEPIVSSIAEPVITSAAEAFISGAKAVIPSAGERKDAKTPAASP
ncbi:unnamed protein product [Oppiella nova]|uniref:ATP-dependent RNA helicase n=1 Tax=Oppiella nova TaxID=334625 RepID=A0A7R9QPQ0_9ACAR|nr:unnamed protein product [Oppiella nova]CAG2169810.1 unnamed protein product [Oppiella nova]